MKTVVAAFMALGLSLPAQAAAPISGKWFTVDNRSIVEIGQCGATLCGRIFRILVPVTGGGTDIYNPDPALRKVPLIGLNILTGFKDSGTQWEGKIYDPEHGKLYRSIVYRTTDGNLAVKGCIAFFCQKQIWKPVR
jgi:uncharacterized protein (DUF2147 family)